MTRSSISRSFLGILLSGGMIALVACSDSTSSSERITVGRTLSLFFQAGNGAPTPPPQIAAVGGIGRVRVTGGYEAGACSFRRGSAHRDGNLLTLDVETVPNPTCGAARVAYSYDATLLGLEPAEYTLEVYHRLDPPAERVLVHRVRITVQ
jgi:hypothetical protein